MFKDQVLGKKYNGKSDRVAIYQYLKGEWNKTPILKKKIIPYPAIKDATTKVVNPIKVKEDKKIRRPSSIIKIFK